MTYKVKLEIFEGPLDLLLHLVKQNHLEVEHIPIAEVTDQYLQYLEIMQALDLEIAGEFLVVAATLMQIKLIDSSSWVPNWSRTGAIAVKCSEIWVSGRI